MSIRNEELMAKKLANQCSFAEEQELNNWLMTHPKNKQLFNEYKQIWENSEEQAVQVDVDAAWLKVKQQTQPRVIKMPSYVFKYAAAIAVFALLGIWVVSLLRPLTTIQTASNQIKQVELPDGSKVWLHEFAKLSYKNNLQGSSREVTLEGLAFFAVKSDKEHPFVITTNRGKVEVLGTSFEVSAYKQDTFERVTVKTGKVRFRSEQGNEVMLTPNQQAVAGTNGLISVTTVDADGLVSWTNNLLEFNNTDMQQVAEKISRYFHVTVKLDNKAMHNCHFTGSFKNPTLIQVVDAVCKTLAIEYTKKGNLIILKGAGCK